MLVLLAAVVLTGGLVAKQHCRAQGWSNPDQFWHVCYSDNAVLFSSQDLGSDLARPSLSEAVGGDGLGQPPLASAAMWVVSAFVPHDGVRGQREFFDLSAAVLLVALGVGVAAIAVTTRRLRGPTGAWDAAHLALSPVVFTAGLLSYTLLAVALLALAFWSWHRRHPGWAGVWLGLAVAAAPSLAVVVLALAVLAVRTTWPTPRAAGTAFVTWLVARLLLVAGLGAGLLASFNAWRTGAVGYGSVWLLPQLLANAKPQPAGTLPGRILTSLFGGLFTMGPVAPGVAATLCVLVTGLLLALVVRVTAVHLPPAGAPVDGALVDDAHPALLSPPPAAGGSGTDPADVVHLPEPPPAAFAPLALAMLCVVLVAATSLPVQTSLLLLPLIALSGLAWRDHLLWAATECVYFVGVWMFIAAESDPSKGLPASIYVFLLVARLAGIAWIGGQALRRYRAMLREVGLEPLGISPAVLLALDPSGSDRPGRHTGRPIEELEDLTLSPDSVTDGPRG
ncbi:hypothetical protein ACIB24_02805 [Spongisporangium articulatum]|uniref:Integral membrane protein n=1 Tax=Spongisporangium articulatum TaxID=3362603 RepID=A0ABW8AI04_9ACTN